MSLTAKYVLKDKSIYRCGGDASGTPFASLGQAVDFLREKEGAIYMEVMDAEGKTLWSEDHGDE